MVELKYVIPRRNALMAFSWQMLGVPRFSEHVQRTAI